MKPVYVVGHKNPDTDSICSAICYANLKQIVTGREHIPCRAGSVSMETKYVLDRFGAAAPRYLDSLEPRLSEVQFRNVKGISADTSLRRAWLYMSENSIHTLPVVDDENHLLGLLTFTDIARFYMEDQGAEAISEAHTSYRNLVDVLNGSLLVGDIDQSVTAGRVSVAAANPDIMEEHINEHDIIILGNRYESQLCAIEMKAGCIVVGLGAKVSRTIQKLARDAGCSIISSPMETYACAKVINQAVPVSHIMLRKNLITFQPNDLVSEVKSTVAKKRIRYYPILDASGKYLGMLSHRNLLDFEKQEVILVDHNERDQAVDGIRAAQVTEIIDHHRIDALETTNPIYFRNQPVGCTATIITQLYQENGVAIEPTIAGLLCSAILSDTLMFRSPTCTPLDRMTAEMLAGIAGIDIKEHATAMFRAGSQLGDRPADEIFHTDFKYYQAKDKRMAVSQVTSVNQDELDALRPKMLEYMKNCLPTSSLSMLFLMLTNIIDETTELLYVGQGTQELVSTAFHCECGTNSVTLPGVVSRKKQFLTPLLSAVEEYD
ncbi:MAG: putative manganese-dependent inorganic diphosphatase [Butyricicoccus sp.]|nr:putative manganese-dependent inorganic diphosphatase [Butyricicoccus sp.]